MWRITGGAAASVSSPTLIGHQVVTRRTTGDSSLLSPFGPCGSRLGGPWRGAWPAEPLDPQPTVEGSYCGWLGPHPGT
jgi:hypothetical protein